MIKLASWNVNSVKMRLGHLLDWLKSTSPDIVCLQEIKCTEADFPRLELNGLGYDAVVIGQKTYNGVAILSRAPACDIVAALPGDDADDQARYLEATIAGIRIASVYLPNGNPAPGEKFNYKLAWMRRLEAQTQSLLDREIPLALAGDFNVAPTDLDVYDPAGWRDDALCRPESRRGFRTLLNRGMTDAFRVLHAEGERYTYWDYIRRRFETDQGLRIDHILLSPQATDRLISCDVDKTPRSRDKPSDHTPIWCELAAP